MKTWHLFAWLIVTAIIYYFIGRLVVVAAVFVLIIRVWWFLTWRFPATMAIFNLCLGALLGGGRGRR